MFFDYVSAAKRIGIPQEKVDQLCCLFRAEFPSDEMMAELHILRAIMSIERGDTTLDEILTQKVAG